MPKERRVRISGTVASALSLGMVLVGLPSQIYQNWLAHEAGISLELAITAFVLYCAWTVYAFLKQDRYLLLAQGAGSVTSLFLLVQTIYYLFVK